MKFRITIIIGLVAALTAGGLFLFRDKLHFTGLRPQAQTNRALSGGEGTVFVTNKEAFAKPLANMPTDSLRAFTFGNKIFNTNWVTAPASVTTLDGLGPTFNRVSCSGCHFKDGRGQPPEAYGDPMNSMLIRLSIPGTDTDGGPKPHPAYGGQLNDKAIHGVLSEGSAAITYEELQGTYADGSAYSLVNPRYEFLNLNFGPLGGDILFSPRVAPAVHGLGLLEAIPDETILAFADPDDKNKDGISGRPNYVWDKIHEKKAIGRFGWKANQPNLESQDAGAAVGDMGITTSINPEENCPEPQKTCRAAVNGGTPEMNEDQRKKMLFYTQTLAVPARRDMDDPMVISGEALFQQIGCNACHKTDIMTGNHEIAELSHQSIHPYTDMLLHDMGDELSDNRPDYEAEGNEWRTAPLWGIGLVKEVNGHTRFLHDGRARNLEEAILWHGGEGKASREAFKNLTKEQRAALIRFLEAL